MLRLSPQATCRSTTPLLPPPASTLPDPPTFLLTCEVLPPHLPALLPSPPLFPFTLAALPLTVEILPLELLVDSLLPVEVDSVADLDEVALRWEEVDEVGSPREVEVRGFRTALVRGGMVSMWLETGT